jgi:AraC-like DNA-binding protein
MRYHRIKPTEEIAKYVKYFWVGEVDVHEEHQFTHFSIATSNAKLIFHYKGAFSEVTPNGELTKSFLSGIQGQSKTHTQFISNENVGIFGVEFQPHAISSLFAISAADLTNQFIDLKIFLGSKGDDLQDQVFSAHSNTERVRIVSQFLKACVKPVRNRIIEDAVHRVNLVKGLVEVGVLSKQYAISQRQFERLFKEAVGFTPKTYAKIIRFESALDNFSTNESFTTIALDCGYFDQSHFIHDFKSFSGFHPTSYFKIMRKLPRRIS